MVFLKEFFRKVDFEKSMQNYPVGKELSCFAAFLESALCVFCKIFLGVIPSQKNNMLCCQKYPYTNRRVGRNGQKTTLSCFKCALSVGVCPVC